MYSCWDEGGGLISRFITQCNVYMSYIVCKEPVRRKQQSSHPIRSYALNIHCQHPFRHFREVRLSPWDHGMPEPLEEGNAFFLCGRLVRIRIKMKTQSRAAKNIPKNARTHAFGAAPTLSSHSVVRYRAVVPGLPIIWLAEALKEGLTLCASFTRAARALAAVSTVTYWLFSGPRVS
jgi:hypothetical protein